MIGLIVIALFLLWLLAAISITYALFVMKKWGLWRARFWASAALVAMLPFAEELFIAGSFYGHCKIYGGASELEPIATDRVTIRGGGWGVARLLAHPAIDAVWITGNPNPELGPKEMWITVATAQQGCRDPINERLANGPVGVAAVATRKLIAQGHCYSTVDYGDKPSIELGKRQRIFHESFSLLLPYGVTEARESVFDMSSGSPQILSSFSRLSMGPGSLSRSIWRHPSKYGCYAATNGDGSADYPFGLKFYSFLKEAIIKENRS